MNRDFRKSASEAPRASITIAAGVGRRPEPVVTDQRKFRNPVGVEYEISTNRIQNTLCNIYSTPTGSKQTDVFQNHGFRFASPAAIIVVTPAGSDVKGGPA